jgi:coenzyme F420-reducing hydrogenase delta subunit
VRSLSVVLRDGFQPSIVADACFGCGICVSSCPARAITAEGEPDLQTSAAAVTVFACERSAALAAREAGLTSGDGDPDVAIIPVPCAGRLDQLTLLQPLLDGGRQVMVVGCYEGNCRSMIGVKTAAARTRHLNEQTRSLSLPISIITNTGSHKEAPHE